MPKHETTRHFGWAYFNHNYHASFLVMLAQEYLKYQLLNPGMRKLWHPWCKCSWAGILCNDQDQPRENCQPLTWNSMWLRFTQGPNRSGGAKNLMKINCSLSWNWLWETGIQIFDFLSNRRLGRLATLGAPTPKTKINSFHSPTHVTYSL